MKKEEIINLLKQKYDDFSSDIISNSIYEFQEVFNQKYLKTEEVINLVTTNIPNGIKIYDNVSVKFDATCSIKDKEFKITKSCLDDKDYFSYLFFHEFIHSISFKKYDINYMGFYTLELDDDYSFKSRAFNEAFTEFLTLKRNEKYNYKKDNGSLSGYELGAVELDLICKIIPEDELIDAYFNKPYSLDNILKKYNMNLDEILYAFYSLEEMDYETYALTNNYGLKNPQNIFKIITGERYIFYNLLDALDKEEINKKWDILFKEHNIKYDFFKIDGLLRYGVLSRELDKINIEIPEEIIEKCKYLNKLNDKDNNQVLKELNSIYKDNYLKYYQLFKDEAGPLAYMFLKEIKNNYELYDIEKYPRVYPYLEKEKQTIENVTFKKIRCDEAKIIFYIFIINGNYYIESNYDDTTIKEVSNKVYEIRYSDQIEILDLNNNTYEKDNSKYNIVEMY